ncbi:hypothetical protein EJC47_19695 [Sphingomonas sp. TF3]|nr:hypothetical protein EJC47_19695 [Sphingomonas sp. TF3]
MGVRDVLDFETEVLARIGADFVGGGLLVEDGLRNLILASYDLGGQVPSGALSYSEGQLQFGGLGFTQSEIRDSSGILVRTELRTVAPADDLGRIDILWRGEVQATASYPRARVDVAQIGRVSIADLDAAIVGPIPADPIALEAARRTALLARLKAAANDADAYDDASVTRLLLEAQVGSVAELLALDGGLARFYQLVLSLTPLPGSVEASQRQFPVAAAFLIRDVTRADFRLADLLQASKTVLQRLRYAGFDPAESAILPPGRAVVAWLVADSWFDADGWPGSGANPAAKRADRIAKASAWLAPQGIALNPVKTN